ncbi:MAG: hypothetical protein ABJB93_09980 [Gaiellales bacterium]
MIVLIVTLRLCRRQQRRGGHPVRRCDGSIVRRRDDGGFESLPAAEDASHQS